MVDNPGESRRLVLFVVIIGIIVVVLGVFLLIGVLSGGDTGEIDPQNGHTASQLVVR